jgi:hypothetical protein
MADDQEIWDAGDASGYLKMSRAEFMRKGRYMKGFPPRLGWSTDRHPKWVAGDVKSWATRRVK